MIKVIQIEAGLFDDPIDEQIEHTLEEKDISRQNLIDIKFACDGQTAYALIIYEEL